MSNAKIELFKPVGTKDYLDAAVKAAEYIKQYEINVPEGKYWAISSNTEKEPDLVESSFLNQRSLYAGAAGIGYFFVQLYEAAGDRQWLEDALKAGDYLIATYEKKFSEDPGLYSGASGEGLFLNLLYEKTGEEKYKKQAIQIADDIYDTAVKDESGIHWKGFYDLMGDAGSVIYWLLVAQKTGIRKYVGYAKEVLDSILKLGVSDENGATYWKLFDPSVYFKTLPEGGLVPNFAHGTAGVMYLLTKYYEATGEESYLEEAKKGYQFLKKIAINEEDASIVPYLYFEKEKKPYDVFYLGYCHGPAGDGIALRELYKVTKDEEYLDFFRRLSQALIKAGVPDKKSAGYWNDCLCCGSAGVLYHFLTAADVDEKYLRCARKTADKSIADAYKDEKGYRWYNAWTRIKPWDVDAHLGLYIGAAGSASALLALYAKLTGTKITALFEYDTES